jgi:hypothetical protein
MKFLDISKDVEVTGLQFQNQMLSYVDFKCRGSGYKIIFSNSLMSLYDAEKSLIASHDLNTGKTCKYSTIDDKFGNDAVLMRILTKDMSEYMLRLERRYYTPS